MMNYLESIEYLESLSIFGIKLGLTRIERLLELLDMPQRKYKTIHVTGTNGKGSVVSMISLALTHSQIKTGIYISPHLSSYRERMQIDGQFISEADFVKCLVSVKEAAEQMEKNGEEYPTQFEVLTAIAFLYFAEMNVEYAVIEVGLGGLLDSTNVILPEISVITNVTMEHADRCGGTLEGIAHHKAGIVKPAVPVVTAAKGLPLDVIREIAKEKNTDVFVMGDDFESEFCLTDGMKQDLEFSSYLLGLRKIPYTLNLLGEYQIENSAIALMCLQLLHNNDERILQEKILQAFAEATWPGRFERFDIGEIKVVIDGAHNPAGIKALNTALEQYYPNTKRVFLIGILKDKDAESMINNLVKQEDVIVVTSPLSERAEDPAILAIKIHAKQVEVEANPLLALEMALNFAEEDAILCITGSLYLIGTIRDELLKKKELLKNASV